jgi:hypothetical protein
LWNQCKNFLDTSRNRICCDLKYPSCIKGDNSVEILFYSDQQFSTSRYRN